MGTPTGWSPSPLPDAVATPSRSPQAWPSPLRPHQGRSSRIRRKVEHARDTYAKGVHQHGARKDQPSLVRGGCPARVDGFPAQESYRAGDVDLGNRRITVGGHVRPLDDLTRRAVLDWFGHRHSRWSNAANPRLLIIQKTAVEFGPAGKFWTARAARNLTATLERLRVARQLEEALPHGADPLHLALVFGIDEKTAIRHADSARTLLGEEAEQSSQ
ncbi:hypothetical protein ABT025_26895 [Streptomyces sp. NPDC002809]|uniref:hypothetical protein n=1 Tax=Streptomyces sp. NPDC002809 TaxID=3154433 RepID=UPI003333D6D0